MGPDTFSLAGKAAIVTGSGRENGIGAAIAQTLARNGARVVINHVSDPSAPRAAKVAAGIKSIGAEAIVVQADVSTPEGSAKLANETLKRFNTERIDILVNNAGSGSAQGVSIFDLTTADIERGFAANTYSTLYAVQAVAPHMPRGGRIVNIGSVISRVRNAPGLAVYGASKAAQEYLTGAMSFELGTTKGITVNTVAPGPVGNTDANDWYPDGDMKTDVGAKLVVGAKLGRVAGEVDEIADAVLLVVSEQGRWITGQYIAASGGITE
ncbi:hypothetical protein QBC39DRAFT_247215 [Podospora conica]|nr:hypothetical protein QBC39DRAFT_247215 [Schizothecium conicum]